MYHATCLGLWLWGMMTVHSPFNIIQWCAGWGIPWQGFKSVACTRNQGPELILGIFLHFPHLNQNRSRGTIWYHVFEEKHNFNPQKARGFSGAKGGREGKLAAEGLQSLGAITISGFLHQKCRGWPMRVGVYRGYINKQTAWWCQRCFFSPHDDPQWLLFLSDLRPPSSTSIDASLWRPSFEDSQSCWVIIGQMTKRTQLRFVMS